MEVSFDSEKDVYSVEAFDSEESLNERVQKCRINVSLGREKLPRIKFGAIYWPPSLHTISQLSRLSQIVKDGKTIHPNQLRLENIEGSSLDAIWEPIYSQYLEFFQKGYMP